jgi:hypothetical protein
LSMTIPTIARDMASPPSELHRLRQHPRHADEAPNLPVF